MTMMISSCHLQREESGMKQILIIVVENETVKGFYTQTMGCCLQHTIIIKHFTK